VSGLALLAAGGPTLRAQPAAQPAPGGTPAVTTADFAWLAGTWRGQLVGSTAQITVTMTPPDAGLITGVMHLVNNGTAQVVELITFIDTPEGVELRYRHFSPTLEAVETTYKQVMRLTRHDATHDLFTNAVPFEKGLVSTEPRTTLFTRHGSDEYVGHSDIVNDEGKPAVIEVTYHRVK
jgi:hypothetical protein